MIKSILKMIKNLLLFIVFISFFSSENRCYGQQYTVNFVTNKGAFTISLYDSTPFHRDNFINLIGLKFYDSLLFHRVIKNFVAQAGDPDSKHAKDTALLGDGDLKYKIPFEYIESYIHKFGALGMARDENPEKESSSCQFYIVTGRKGHDSLYEKAYKRTGLIVPEWKKVIYNKIGGTPHLDTRYTVFGEVTQGMKVILKICKMKTDKNNRPLKPVRIISASFTKLY